MKEWLKNLVVVSVIAVFWLSVFKILSVILEILYDNFGHTIGLVVMYIGLIFITATIITVGRKLVK